jgi:GGDEF domain-containing protein
VVRTLINRVLARSTNLSFVRAVVLSAGLLSLLLMSIVMVLRGVDRVEVIAGLLYVLVFIAVVALDVIGGLVAALVSTAIYLLMRYSAIEVLGTGHFAALVLVRLLAYLSFGLIGGLAWKILRTRLDKLENYDEVDDDTLLMNARGFAELVDREMARARRYKTSFAVAAVDLPASAFGTLSRKQRHAVLRRLGTVISEGTRTVDQVGVALDRERYRVNVLLPQTDAKGAKIFSSRLLDRVSGHLLQQGVPLPRQIEDFAYAFPGDAVELSALRDDLQRISREQFPNADIES